MEDNKCKLCGGIIEKIEADNEVFEVCVVCGCPYDYVVKEWLYELFYKVRINNVYDIFMCCSNNICHYKRGRKLLYSRE